MSYETFLDELPASDASDCADDILGQTLSSVDFELEETVRLIVNNMHDMFTDKFKIESVYHLNLQ